MQSPGPTCELLAREASPSRRRNAELLKRSVSLELWAIPKESGFDAKRYRGRRKKVRGQKSGVRVERYMLLIANTLRGRLP